MRTNTVLKDIGEFKLLREYIFPTLTFSQEYLGDDCAFLDFPAEGKVLVITTDAGPKPLFFNWDAPYYFIWGWYTVLANVSDLASTGCIPLSLSLSIEADNNMLVDDLVDYFKGVNTACIKFGIPVTGGNVKANTKFIASGTAIGFLERGQRNLKRSDCKVGDALFSIGDNGKFITSYLNYKRKGYAFISEDERRKLRGPSSQLENMQILNKAFHITSASDNSDGILGSISNISERSKCGFMLDLDSIALPSYINDFALELGLNPWNIFLFWGDWQIILTVKQDECDQFNSFCKAAEIPCTKLGYATLTDIKAKIDGSIKGVNIVRNENFSATSYNNSIEDHIDYFLKSELFYE